MSCIGLCGKGRIMIKVAFCDDDLSVLKELSVLMERYRVERNQDITYAAFHSPLELLSEVERGTRLDIIFLDVLMPGQDGISAAREIRKYDTSVKIIYLTSSSEYAVDSYEVGAYFYQLKPIWQESFYRLMDSVLRECRKNEKNSLILRCKTGITRLELDKLKYCEVTGRNLLLHKEDGEVLDSVGKLDDLCEQLKDYECFVRCHRSYMINMDYVKSISNKAVILSDGTQIPIPHGKYSELKDKFFSYFFRKNQTFLASQNIPKSMTFEVVDAIEKKENEVSNENSNNSEDDTPVDLYKIIEGTRSTWNGSTTEGLTIRGDGDFEKFAGVRVDGNWIPSVHYEAKSGSTIVTLKPSYLASLSEGEHTVDIMWIDDSASTTFTVAANTAAAQPELDSVPKTGEGVMGWMPEILLLVAAGLVTFGGLLRRRSKIQL